MHPRYLAIMPLIFALALAVTPHSARQASKAPYPSSMAPLDEYLMDHDSEVALARSAGPESISGEAKVLVLGRHGYETAVEGKNGFVCLVARMWTARVDDPEFWNPRGRGPMCLNAVAVRSHLPVIVKRTELAIAGRTKNEIAEAISGAIKKGDLPTPEPNAMSYMLSKQGYLNDAHGHWYPHVMLFLPEVDPKSWGANLQGAPVFGVEDPVDHLTLFHIPVGKWSDGTPSPTDGGN